MQLTEIKVENGSLQAKDYFKLAVLWILSGENKPVIRKIKRGEAESTLKDPAVLDMIKKAVPGQNSFLMDLAIRTNVHEAVISSRELSLEEKVEQIAYSIQKFVVLA